MGKKRKKDHPIPCDYLAPEKSRRPEILYRAVRPHLASGESYLDATCGYAVLADYIIPAHEPASYTGFDMNEKVIDYCRARHPKATWTVSMARYFPIETRFDVVFHIGVSSIRYNVHEIHQRITERPEGFPRLVLVEHGATETGDDDTGLTYAAIRDIYTDHGLTRADEGEFYAENIPYPIRRWTILTRRESRDR
ncbi:MAG: class I SAM-dependent methyltransferase [Deltaproteobacteria bacterium]|nr:class I SAM-dependent methyltransferase [Candidatus Zymogenaceae bacterium]